MNVLDYGLSFVGSVGPNNAVRFWLESRTVVIDEQGGAREEYLQCGSCKSEDTFAEKDLFVKDNYDFLPVFGPEHSLIFRRRAYLNPTYRETRLSRECWGGQILHLKEAEPAQLLETNAAIREATHAGLPIVSHTEIRNDQTRMRAVIECPVKTMNINDERDVYQVDTGPVMYPDLSQRPDRIVDCLALAFVAFNVPHFADFVIETETPLLEDGRELCQVHHYSQHVSLPAANRLYAIGG